ncbi:extracellular solute-binding protein [Methylotetracoccus oryzae]|uniref:extracellular solute-binding protein n=1 Tax=Methylotetracoccus oryzae TaxID=1919059 RepID=UPI00111805FC|nr:extracellular solute-binding protein [Methylotetracoccus oryzae]
MHYRRRLAIVIVITFMLAACGGDDRQTLTRLKVWAMGAEAEALVSLVPGFEHSHPGIRVEIHGIPWSVAHEKLLTAHVGDALPDLFQLGNTWIAELAEIGALDDLSARFASQGDAGDFFPGALAANRYREGLYGLPWYVDTRLLFYRADLLEAAGIRQPPMTWVEWSSVMSRLAAAAEPGRYALAMAYDEWRFPVILALQRGAALLREDGRFGNFRHPRFRAAFALFLDAFRRGWAPPIGEAQRGNPALEFVQGRFVFFVGGPWMIGEIGRRLTVGWGGRWETAPLPSWDDNHPGASLAGGSSLALAAHSLHREAALELMQYLTQTEQQLALYRLTGDLPSRRSAWNDPALADDRHAQPFRLQLERTMTVPQVPEWERIAAKIGYYGELAVRDQLTEDAALQRLDRDVDAILEKRRWLLDRR